MKKNITLAAGILAVALTASACATDGASKYTLDDAEVQHTPTSTTVAPAADRYTYTTSVAPEPDYLTVTEAIDIVSNGGTVQPGDMKATTDVDNLFIAYLDGKGISLSDDEALRAAVTTCSFLANGGDTDQLWAEIAADPYAPDIIPGVDNASELPVLMGAAAGAYCSHLG